MEQHGETVGAILPAGHETNRPFVSYIVRCREWRFPTFRLLLQRNVPRAVPYVRRSKVRYALSMWCGVGEGLCVLP